MNILTKTKRPIYGGFWQPLKRNIKWNKLNNWMYMGSLEHLYEGLRYYYEKFKNLILY